MADSPGISEKVRTVAQMGRSELVSEWQAQFGAPPPPTLRVRVNAACAGRLRLP